MLNSLLLLIWLCSWLAGGWLLAATLFRLGRKETGLVGLGLGLVLEIWLSNLLSQAVPIPQSFWISAALVLASGISAAFPVRRHIRVHLEIGQWITLGALVLLFTAIGRGLGIFDDYQNLPTVSLMAAGDVPPHFALDPSLRFGYHYLLLLLAAQLMRVGSMFPWSALDLARGLSLALPLCLAGLWGFRLTRSRAAALLSGVAVAFAGGARWLLLLLPADWLSRISNEITLIGSAATSAPTLAEAMIGNWKIDGAGPIPFPFAFYSGMNQPYVMAYTGIAGSGILVLLLLLLTERRGRHWGAAALRIAVLASLAIANEIAFLLLGLGTAVATGVWLADGRRRKGAVHFRRWVATLAAATVIAVLQGGMLTEAALNLLGRQAASGSYFDPIPTVVWPPALVSAHLGSLSMANIQQITAALVEIGPVVLVTPLVFAWARKSLRLGKWYEAGLVASAFGVLLAATLKFRGPLFTAAPRLMGGWFFTCALYFVPLLWLWLRGRADVLRTLASVVGAVSCLGGLMLFGVQLPAIQTPTYATFITPMDAKIAADYWNTLESDDLVFDPVVFRAPTVLALFTKSSPSWYTRLSEWQELYDNPSPKALRAAGFGYVYLDGDYWERINPQQQAALQDACVVELAQVDGIHSQSDYTRDFRRLLDIRTCE